MRNNIEYLRESINNNENLDKRYMSLEKDKNINQILAMSKKVKQVLKLIKEKKIKSENYDLLQNELLEMITSDFGSKTEFGCFINACDSTVGTLKSNKDVFSEIIDLYFENRDFDDNVSEIWTQALIDKGSQRSMGTAGENKLIEIAENFGFKYTNNYEEFSENNFSITKYSQKFKNKINPSLNFGSQNKKLDIIIKANNQYFFLEAKHIKDAGGAQDKQIKELIGLFKFSMPENQFIISFLDGVYSNTLLDISEPVISDPSLLNRNNQSKIITQQYEILKSLFENPNAIWINTKGYELLLYDLINFID
jgi:hypothetical protein